MQAVSSSLTSVILMYTAPKALDTVSKQTLKEGPYSTLRYIGLATFRSTSKPDS